MLHAVLFCGNGGGGMAPNGRRESGAKKTTSAKQESSFRIVYTRVCPKFQFQKNFNLQLAFFKFFYVSSSGSSSVRSTAAAVTQPEPQTTKTPTDAARTDGRSRLVEEAQKTLSWPNGRPTLGSAYYDVRQGSSKLGHVGSVNKIHV